MGISRRFKARVYLVRSSKAQRAQRRSMLTIESSPVDAATSPVLDTPEPLAPPAQDDGFDDDEEEEDDAENDQDEENDDDDDDDDDDFGDDFDDFEEGGAGDDDFDDFEESFQQPEVPSAPTHTAPPPQQATLPFVSLKSVYSFHLLSDIAAYTRL